MFLLQVTNELEILMGHKRFNRYLSKLFIVRP